MDSEPQTVEEAFAAWWPKNAGWYVATRTCAAKSFLAGAAWARTPTLPATEYAGDHDEFVNELLDLAPDDWDDDVAAEEIALLFLRHTTEEVERLGGCLHRACAWVDDEPCDHGYLATSAGARTPTLPAGARERLTALVYSATEAWRQSDRAAGGEDYIVEQLLLRYEIRERAAGDRPPAERPVETPLGMTAEEWDRWCETEGGTTNPSSAPTEREETQP